MSSELSLRPSIRTLFALSLIGPMVLLSSSESRAYGLNQDSQKILASSERTYPDPADQVQPVAVACAPDGSVRGKTTISRGAKPGNPNICILNMNSIDIEAFMVGLYPPSAGAEKAALKIRQVILASAGSSSEFDLTWTKGDDNINLHEIWTKMGVVHKEKIGKNVIDVVDISRSIKSIIGTKVHGSSEEIHGSVVMSLPVEMIAGKKTALLIPLIINVPSPEQNLNTTFKNYRARSFHLSPGALAYTN